MLEFSEGVDDWDIAVIREYLDVLVPIQTCDD
jgi:hypothetical protein